MPAGARDLCDQHGLALANDGGCVLCRRAAAEAGGERDRRGGALWPSIAFTASCMAVLFGWMALRERPDKALALPQHTLAVVTMPVQGEVAELMREEVRPSYRRPAPIDYGQASEERAAVPVEAVLAAAPAPEPKKERGPITVVLRPRGMRAGGPPPESPQAGTPRERLEFDVRGPTTGPAWGGRPRGTPPIPILQPGPTPSPGTGELWGYDGGTSRPRGARGVPARTPVRRAAPVRRSATRSSAGRMQVRAGGPGRSRAGMAGPRAMPRIRARGR